MKFVKPKLLQIGLTLYVFDSLRDRQASARINRPIRCLSAGNPGDIKPVDKGASEFRISYRPGYRVYFVQRDKTLIISLAAETKSPPKASAIKKSLELAKNV